MHDNFCDFLTRIRNGLLQKQAQVEITKNITKQCYDVLYILRKFGYIQGYTLKVKKIKTFKKTAYCIRRRLCIFLKYTNNVSELQEINVVSKKSRQIFFSIKMLSRFRQQLILSTDRGVMLSQDAVKYGIGGKVLCIIR